MVVLESVADLAWSANLAALELHVPQWQVDEDGVPQLPDLLVLDLDPGPAGAEPDGGLVVLVRLQAGHLGVHGPRLARRPACHAQPPVAAAALLDAFQAGLADGCPAAEAGLEPGVG